MPYFKMVRMEFTCILYKNTFLVGRYWDFKHLLLPNCWANLDQTWQVCSEGGGGRVLFKNCSKNLIPSKPLVAMATELNFLSNSLKIFYSETAGPILK